MYDEMGNSADLGRGSLLPPGGGQVALTLLSDTGVGVSV